MLELPLLSVPEIVVWEIALVLSGVAFSSPVYVPRPQARVPMLIDTPLIAIVVPSSTSVQGSELIVRPVLFPQVPPRMPPDEHSLVVNEGTLPPLPLSRASEPFTLQLVLPSDPVQLSVPLTATLTERAPIPYFSAGETFTVPDAVALEFSRLLLSVPEKVRVLIA